MTNGEQLVWAAAYADKYGRMIQELLDTGRSIQIAECIENAASAVLEMRHAYSDVQDGWGEGDTLSMLEEILEKPPFDSDEIEK